MRAIVQRVSRAGVEIDGQAVGRIGEGLLVYVGIGRDDGPTDLEYVSNKILGLRVFADQVGKMNLDVAQIGGAVLVVSNFTLFGNARKGRRPAFTEAAEPAMANEMYEGLCAKLREAGLEVQMGRFGAKMAVQATNDGPINILLDSKRGF